MSHDQVSFIEWHSKAQRSEKQVQEPSWTQETSTILLINIDRQ